MARVCVLVIQRSIAIEQDVAAESAALLLAIQLFRKDDPSYAKIRGNWIMQIVSACETVLSKQGGFCIGKN